MTNSHTVQRREHVNGLSSPMARPHPSGSNKAGVSSAAVPELQFWHGTFGALPSRSSAPPPARGWRDAPSARQGACIATAVLSASLAPAATMTALWPKVAPITFVFTFVIAFCHAAFLGLPLFLIGRRRWTNVITCIVFGFLVGAAPIRAVIRPAQYPALHTVNPVPSPIDGTVMAAEWITYVRSQIYFGCFGAIGGFAFWVALVWSGMVGRTKAAIDLGSWLRTLPPFARPTLRLMRRRAPE